MSICLPFDWVSFLNFAVFFSTEQSLEKTVAIQTYISNQVGYFIVCVSSVVLLMKCVMERLFVPILLLLA